MNTREITESYDGFFTTVESLIDGTGDFSVEKEFMSHVSTLCKYGLDSLVHDHFLISLLVLYKIPLFDYTSLKSLVV